MKKINQTDRKNNLCVFPGMAGNEAGENMTAPFLPFFAVTFLNINPAQYGFIEGMSVVIYLALSRYFSTALNQLGLKAAFGAGCLLISAARLGLSLVQTWPILLLFRSLKQTGQVAADRFFQSAAPSEAPAITPKILKIAAFTGTAAGPFLGLFFLSLACPNSIGSGCDDNAGDTTESAFRWLFMWAAAPSLLGAWIIWLFFREDGKESSRRQEEQATESVTDVITPRPFAEKGRDTPVYSSPLRLNNLKSFFSNKPVFYLALSYFSLSLAAVPLPMILFYIYQEVGLGITDGIIIFIVYLLSYSAALLYPAGFIINRLGRWLSHLTAGLLCAGAFFLILLAKSSFLLITAMILYGLFTAIWELLRRSEPKLSTDPAKGGAVSYGLAGILSPVLLGVCWTAFSARFAFVMMVIFCAISLIILNYAQRFLPDEKG